MLEKNETNTKSVISLTLGILTIFLPMIGLVLGILGVVFSRIATKEIVKTNESGKGLATSGLICSVVGIVIQLFIVLSFIAYNSLTIVG
ncbi:DUF4190 domain-containing protein [Sporosarcina aquimarina]|nr:DUF4190 domain-containing protein [Sporosarcina aquimarina]MCM3757526.1 DUF4190 domain-containing protein [Sporosarcina aquimarina]